MVIRKLGTALNGADVGNAETLRGDNNCTCHHQLVTFFVQTMASVIRNAVRSKLRIGMIPADGIGREVLPVSHTHYHHASPLRDTTKL